MTARTPMAFRLHFFTNIAAAMLLGGITFAAFLALFALAYTSQEPLIYRAVEILWTLLQYSPLWGTPLGLLLIMATEKTHLESAEDRRNAPFTLIGELSKKENIAAYPLSAVCTLSYLLLFQHFAEIVRGQF